MSVLSRSWFISMTHQTHIIILFLISIIIILKCIFKSNKEDPEPFIFHFEMPNLDLLNRLFADILSNICSQQIISSNTHDSIPSSNSY